MAKATKKPAKKASDLFHNIMAASVKRNPKPLNKEQSNNIKAYVFNCTSDDRRTVYALDENGSELSKCPVRTGVGFSLKL